ncbi:MAG: fasciclin domain-containing protein [Granulosicoccus sp.]
MNLPLRPIAIPLASLALVITMGAASASPKHWNGHHSHNSSRSTITDIVSRSGGEFDNNNFDFDILLQAVTDADLADALADRDANLTLLAPSDKAFIRLAQDLGYGGDDEAGSYDAIVAALTSLGNGNPIPVLQNVLLYHVVPERARVRNLAHRDSIDTLLEGSTITPDRLRLVDNEPDLRNARFVRPANRRAANGFVHAINRVLLPIDIPGNTVTPKTSITEIVAASGGVYDGDDRDYDILLNAVIAADLADALSDPKADLTVFAPTDRAFIRLARDLGYRGRDESGAFDAIVAALDELSGGAPIPLLTNILLYHVSAGSKTLKEVTDAKSVDTLLVDASFSSFGTFLIDKAPRLRAPNMISSASNIRATNGIVHTINRVLVPLDVAPTRRYRH